jgi:site-specific DNA recombinase
LRGRRSCPVTESGGSWSKSGRWGTSTIRDSMIKGDAYRPHTYEEITALVASEVAARLDRLKLYGVWWCNRGRSKTEQVSAIGRNGKEYVRRFESTPKPREEWVAVPVPDPGVPREWVHAAREAIKENRRPSPAGHRFWELSGGILRCGGCGYAMMTNSISSHGSKRFDHYYRCPKRLRDREACPQPKNGGPTGRIRGCGS